MSQYRDGHVEADDRRAGFGIPRDAGAWAVLVVELVVEPGEPAAFRCTQKGPLLISTAPPSLRRRQQRSLNQRLGPDAGQAPAELAELRIASLPLELKHYEKGRVVKFTPSEDETRRH